MQASRYFLGETGAILRRTGLRRQGSFFQSHGPRLARPSSQSARTQTTLAGTDARRPGEAGGDGLQRPRFVEAGWARPISRPTSVVPRWCRICRLLVPREGGDGGWQRAASSEQRAAEHVFCWLVSRTLTAAVFSQRPEVVEASRRGLLDCGGVEPQDTNMAGQLGQAHACSRDGALPRPTRRAGRSEGIQYEYRRLRVPSF